MDPEKWFAQYDEKLQEAAAKAKAADRAVREVSGSATSPDGAVTVRVNASGATTDLVLRPEAGDVEPEQLARLILETGRQAQRDVGAQVVAAMTPLVGEGAALNAVKEHLPAGFAGDGTEQPTQLRADTRPDDDYFDSPPEVIS